MRGRFILMKGGAALLPVSVLTADAQEGRAASGEAGEAGRFVGQPIVNPTVILVR
jgi:hypothetical protein